MKLLYTLLFAGLLLNTSCSSDSTNADGSAKTKSSNSAELTIPTDLCSLITKEMIQTHFGISADELEFKADTIGSAKYATCGYTWKKENYEELSKLRLDAAMAMSMPKEGQKKTTVSDMLKLEMPNGMVFAGKFKIHDKERSESAIEEFKRYHHTPTKEDLKNFKDEVQKSEELTDDQKDMGKDLGGGIGSNIKFKEVTGVGDLAYYAYLDRSVDVLVGDVSFSVIVDSDKSIEENIEAGKSIAQEIIDKISK